MRKATLKQLETPLSTPVEVEVPGVMLEREIHTDLPEAGALLVGLALNFSPRRQLVVSIFCDTDESLRAFRYAERFEVKALVVGGTHRPTYVRATGDAEWCQVILVD